MVVSRSGLSLLTNSNAPIFVNCFRQIIATDGVSGLFRGLSLNIVGVFPTRAIYFGAYSEFKRVLTIELSGGAPAGPLVHMLSATCASLITHTVMNPVWFVKTRLQLAHQLTGDEPANGLRRIASVVRRSYRKGGLREFYRGLSASYLGISETVLTFVLYEALKEHIVDRDRILRVNGKLELDSPTDEEQSSPRPPALKRLVENRYLQLMLASAASKLFATTVCYPHEVVRTRLRETPPGQRPLLREVTANLWRNGGVRSLYAGLGVHLLRQVPNAAIVLTTYELCVVALSGSSASGSASNSGRSSSPAPSPASSSSTSSPLGPLATGTSSSLPHSHKHESYADGQDSGMADSTSR